MEQYTHLIMSELRTRAKDITHKKINSIYFGGGTPSLLPAENILAIREEIARVGFDILPDAESTIEINPGTITQKKLDLYLAAGINRFSVGVQTFNDAYLKNCGREHNAESSRETLRLLEKNQLNYSFDLLFGLPGQSHVELQEDLSELLSFSPKHVSLYNLTVPTKHKMNAFRAPDEEQAEMFALIDSRLSGAGLIRYELSNFSLPGHESKHNQLYWSDSPYWGVGVSAHSYLPDHGQWGQRFWNPTSYKEYISQVEGSRSAAPLFYDSLPDRQVERLRVHESLTDYCHTQLRMMRGLSLEHFTEKFGQVLSLIFTDRAKKLVNQGLLLRSETGFRLSPRALPIANRIFLDLTFLPEELPVSTH